MTHIRNVTFVNAILVDVYNFLRVYRYFSSYSLRTKHTTFLSSTASFVHRSFSFSHHLTLPKVGSTFQMTGRHDLIGSSRSVKIFEAASGSSTSGSKSYFLFKLHDPTSGESGRQQQLTTRLSSCILDMCVESMNIPELNPVVVDHSRPGHTLKQSGRFKDHVLGKPT